MNRTVESRRPQWAAALTFALAACVLSAPSVAGAQTKTTAAKEQLPDGKSVYATTCAACHQATGEGVSGVFPPLAGSEWATGDEAKAVRILLHGVTGPIEVAGETFNGMMPPWGPTLKDADIAAVLTYVRSTWGNKGTPVTAATVAKIRAATASRTTPWTAAELAAVK